jgi:hypothetical protein
MIQKRGRKLHIQCWVRYDPNYDVVGHRKNCPISHRIQESDPTDVFDVDVKRDQKQRVIIAFSRRSTDMRYWYEAPPDAVVWVNRFDSGKRPRGFMLELTDADLVEASPRLHNLPGTSSARAPGYEIIRVPVDRTWRTPPVAT